MAPQLCFRPDSQFDGLEFLVCGMAGAVVQESEVASACVNLCGDPLDSWVTISFFAI